LAIPAFGYQNHISADRRQRLIRRWLVTTPPPMPGPVWPICTASAVWAYTGYRSKKNEDLLRQRMLKSHIHRKKPEGRPMPERTARANAKSAVRAHIEHVFAEQKARMGLFVRTMPGPGDHQDRACQPGPQHAPPALAETPAGPCLTIQPITPSAGHRPPQPTAIRNRWPRPLRAVSLRPQPRRILR